MANWNPKYVKKNQGKRSNEIVSNIEWNDLFNLLMAQGNWNAEALYDLINDGNLTVQKALFASDSAKLNGKLPEFYAFRDNVLGRDETKDFIPVLNTHPTNKKYVDNIKHYLEAYYFVNGITIQGVFQDSDAFMEADLTGKKGDAYLVGRELYVWDYKSETWNNTGSMVGPGVPKDGEDGQLIIKNGPREFDTAYTSYTEEKLVLSDTTRNLTVSITEPIDPAEGDVWIKI